MTADDCFFFFLHASFTHREAPINKAFYPLTHLLHQPHTCTTPTGRASKATQGQRRRTRTYTKANNRARTSSDAEKLIHAPPPLSTTLSSPCPPPTPTAPPPYLHHHQGCCADTHKLCRHAAASACPPPCFFHLSSILMNLTSTTATTDTHT